MSAHVCFQMTLVRHGVTEANKQHIIQGQKDTPLSDDGRRQSSLLAARLCHETFSKVYSSNLVRAIETAEIATSQLKTSVEIVQDARLKERGFGIYEGQPVSSLVSAARQKKLPVPKYTPPGGEKLEQLKSRVVDFFEALCQCAASASAGIPEDGDTILFQYLKSKPETSLPHPCVGHFLVVCHGGVIHVLMDHMHDICKGEVPSRPLTTPNTAISSFLITIETHPQPRCVSVSTVCAHDSTHLN